MYNIKQNIHVLIYILALGLIRTSVAAEQPNHQQVFDQLLKHGGYVLSLHGCALDDNALCLLSGKLKNNTGITSACLGANSFSDKGFKALVDILPCTAITTLSVNNNKITDEGIGYFCASKYANDKDSPLKYIDVRDNALTDNSRIWLARIAAANKKLQICCSWDQQSEILKNTFNLFPLQVKQDEVTEVDEPLATGCSLFYTIWNERIDDEACASLIKKLIAHGADVNFRDDVNGGLEVLHLAILSKGIKTVKVLCDAGANIYSQTNNKRTALDIATEHEKMDIVNLLLDYAKKETTKQ